MKRLVSGRSSSNIFQFWFFNVGYNAVWWKCTLKYLERMHQIQEKNLRALILLGEEKLQIPFAFGNVSILSGKSEDIAETFK